MTQMRTFDQADDRFPDLIAAARHIVPEVLAVQEQAEKSRQIPRPLAETISDAGLYQMFLARSVGGPEASPLVAFQAIENCRKPMGQSVGAS